MYLTMRKHYQIFHFNGETLSDNRPCVRKYSIAGVSFENIYLYPLRMYDIYQKEDFPLPNSLHRLSGKSKISPLTIHPLIFPRQTFRLFGISVCFLHNTGTEYPSAKIDGFAAKNIFSNLIMHKRYSSRHDCSLFPRKRDFCKFNLI